MRKLSHGYAFSYLLNMYKSRPLKVKPQINLSSYRPTVNHFFDGKFMMTQ